MEFNTRSTRDKTDRPVLYLLQHSQSVSAPVLCRPYLGVRAIDRRPVTLYEDLPGAEQPSVILFRSRDKLFLPKILPSSHWKKSKCKKPHDLSVNKDLNMNPHSSRALETEFVQKSWNVWVLDSPRSTVPTSSVCIS